MVTEVSLGTKGITLFVPGFLWRNDFLYVERVCDHLLMEVG